MKWYRRFLALAAMVATWSKDPSTQCGAVIVTPDHRVVSLGYNGFPVGIEDRPEWLADRATRLRMIRHAEANALQFAAQNVRGCHLYVHPMPPCAQCASAIIQAGLARIVTPRPSADQLLRWWEDWALAQEMYRQAGVDLVEMGEAATA
jgi:dCMP deaminase